MRITMLTIGSTGDVRPYILLGHELKKRGHVVTIASFSFFRNMILDAGLFFFPLSGDAGQMIQSIMQPDTNALTYLPRFMKRLDKVIPHLITDLESSCSNADAMICNFFGSVYYSVAEKYKIPCVQTHFFPMDPTSAVPISSIRNQHLGRYMNKASYSIGYFIISLVEKHYLTDWREQSNLSKRKISFQPNYKIGNHIIPVIYAVSPSVFPRPSEWGKHIHMSGFWFDESPERWSPDPQLESFLSQDEVVIYIGFGSMNAGNMNRLLAMVLRAVRASGIRAIISTGWAGRKFTSTKRVFFSEYIPHSWLFTRVKAVVHHGGAGTTAAGLRYGRPTLVIPFAGDQPFWGHRVYELGCGPKPIPRESLTVQKLTRALIDLVSQKKYESGAIKISKSLQSEHGVFTAADIIDKEITGW